MNEYEKYRSKHPFKINGQYIAAANPQVIIELLDQVEDYQKALEYYANKKNWYNVNSRDKTAPVLNMVIGSMDTEGDNWIGGKRAREILSWWTKRDELA